MAATVWSGYLTFGLISMPVRLYSGARSTRISFHMLHRDDLTRVRQQLFCPEDGHVVERKEIVKGYEYRKGEYVVIEPQEIKKIEPKTAKAMEILEFVKKEEIDPVYFESSYYLAPEEAGKKPYALLTRALVETDYVAVAKLTMHNREYTVFLRPYADGIMLHTMYYQEEIRQPPKMAGEDTKLKEAELKIAHQLIQALEAPWQPEKFHDTFEDNVKKLIQAHLEGKEVTPVEKPRKPSAPVDLMAALKESLAQTAGHKKSPQAIREAEEESAVQLTSGKKTSARKRQKRAA